MPSENQDNLFEIRITETGRNYIFKAARIAGVVIGIAVVNSTISLVLTINRIIRYYSLTTGAFKSYIWDGYKYADMLIACVMVLNIFSVANYYLFISTLKKNIVKVNEDQFNLSFRFMLRNMLFFIAVATINLLATGIYYIGTSVR